MFNGIKWLMIKQMRALTLIAPGPIGQGLTYEEAAKVLRISEYSLISRLNHFKNRFPDAWDNFESIRGASKRQRESLRNPDKYLGYETEIQITEKF